MEKLVTVTSKTIIKDLREQKDISLVYPLKSFCVGYDEYFSIEEIDDFVLVNRSLVDDELDELEKILNNSNIKGIIFDDLGILEIIKDLNVIKILILDHLATNVQSINYYLEYVDSIVVSSDLTKEEIKYIIDNSKKDLVLSVFGLKKLMYSRRLLLSNYATYHNIENKSNIDAYIDNKSFRIKENEYGTCFYAKEYYNALELREYKAKYYWYDLIDMTDKDIIDLIINNKINVPNNSGFLYQKTIYKLKEDK